MTADLDVSALLEAHLPHGVAAAVAVIQDGELRERRVVGYANLEWSVPATPDTVFRLASLTKPFTAMAVMALAEAGRLELDAAVGDVLPEAPVHTRGVKLIHLLNHTSGIIDYLALPGFWDGPSRRAVQLDEACRYFLDQPLQSEPGVRYAYSNSGYVLLGKIIEIVCGAPYADVLKERLFEPLGLRRTFHAHVAPIICGRAAGYTHGEDGLLNAPFMSMTWPHASGALGSTLDDMIIWDGALTQRRLLSEAAYRRMAEPAILADGSPAPYGIGWQLGDYAGLRCIHHSGAMNGFSNHHLRIPEIDLSVIFLSNIGKLNSTLLVLSIVDMAFGLDPSRPGAPEKTFTFGHG